MNALDKLAVLLAGLLALTACGDPPADTATPPVTAEIGASSSPAPTASSLAAEIGAPSSPAPTASSLAADITAIRTAGAAKDRAYKIGNAVAVASVYENDAIIMPQSEGPAKGQAAIRRFLLDYMARLSGGGYTVIVASAVEIDVSGNLGFRSGTYVINENENIVPTDFGKWLEVWSKSGDTWRISRDIWNSDTLPLMLPGEEPILPGEEPADVGEPAT